MITLRITDTPTPLRQDEAGGFRVGKTRVTLDSLMAAYFAGAGPEEISLQYPTLELPDIYATLSFYWHHKDEVEAYLHAREAEAQQRRADHERRFGLTGLRERLLQRRASGGSGD
jgi:uncharacterized protein (DUF433 family)